MNEDQFKALVRAISDMVNGTISWHMYVSHEDDPATVIETVLNRPIPSKDDDYYLNGERYVVRKVTWSHRTYEHGPKAGRLMTFGAEILLGKPL